MTVKKFRVRYEIDVELPVDAIWPDGDAPENPTPADVRRLFGDRSYQWHRTVSDWNLDDDADLTVTEVP